MMDEYQNALEDMNNAAGVYPRHHRGQALVQSVFSLRRMYEAIMSYTRMVIIPYAELGKTICLPSRPS